MELHVGDRVRIRGAYGKHVGESGTIVTVGREWPGEYEIRLDATELTRPYDADELEPETNNMKAGEK